ncbi:hypothetical protein EYF80_045258 [Liparis tanakae]|uniref:Uncharacterized protein n=1 Tax=Liparis tanakae TaxID=230148 RepID=A0A4Z2FUK7_9TELE|nr:hypothetical protein EYF80_045258 [Liparis tanakae]
MDRETDRRRDGQRQTGEERDRETDRWRDGQRDRRVRGQLVQVVHPAHIQMPRLQHQVGERVAMLLPPPHQGVRAHGDVSTRGGMGGEEEEEEEEEDWGSGGGQHGSSSLPATEDLRPDLRPET